MFARRSQPERPKKIFRKSIKKIGLVFLLFAFAISMAKIPGTNSYFTDSVTVDGITLTAGEWESAPTDEIKKGDVVINEVMWMGSKADPDRTAYDGPNDQWVELKNVSGHDLHLKGWYLTYKKADTGNENKLAEITNDKIVKNGEYFLLARYSESNSAISVDRDDNFGMSGSDAFKYNKFQIKLYTDKDQTLLVDTAGDGLSEPTKGDKTNFYSMERNDTPENGEDYANWHTCDDDVSIGLYWDGGRTERGTPGAANLSREGNALVNEAENIQNNVSGGEAAVQNSPEKNGNIDNNQNNNNNGGQNDSVSKKTNSGKIRKNIPIRFTGSLDIAENLKYKKKLRIKRVSLKGDFSQNEIVIDLAKLGTIEKSGELKIKTSDLDLSEGVSVVSPQRNKVILLLTIKAIK